VVLVNNQSLGQHHPGASRHPSSAEEGSSLAIGCLAIKIKELEIDRLTINEQISHSHGI